MRYTSTVKKCRVCQENKYASECVPRRRICKACFPEWHARHRPSKEAQAEYMREYRSRRRGTVQ